MTGMHQSWASQAEGTRFLVPGVSWRAYRTLVEDLPESSPIRVAYDGRDMELMVRGPMHHRHARWIDRLVMTIADGREIPIEDMGETTWLREQVDRGNRGRPVLLLRPGEDRGGA